MSSIINSTTTSPGGLISTGDSSNSLLIQTGDTTAITINSSQQVALTNPLGAASGGTGLSSPGTNGNVLTSNGSAWVSSAPAPSIGGGGTTATDNVTLTSSSAADQYVTPSAHGYYVTLPDATTLSEGSGLFNIHNNSSYFYGVRNSAGTTLCFVAPFSSVTCSLADNGTAAGTWNFGNQEQLGTAAQTTLALPSSTSSNFGTVTRVVNLDSQYQVLVFCSEAAIYAVAYDNTNNTFGSVVLVRTVTTEYSRVMAVKVSSTSLLVTSCSTTTAFESVLLSVSGTTITVNTAATATLAGNSTSINDVQVVGSTYVFAYRRATNVAALRAITVSGTTVTIGSEYTLGGTTTSSSSFGNLFKTSNSTFFAVSFGGTTIYVNTYSVSGTTLTAGTQATTTSSEAAKGVYLNTNNNLMFVGYTGGFWKGCVASVSGTTVSISTVNLAAQGSTASTYNTTFSGFWSGNQLLAGFYQSNNSLGNQYAVGFNVLTDSSGTAVAGTANVSIQVPSTGTGPYYQCAGYDSTSMYVVGSSAASNNQYIYIRVGINGNDPDILTQQYFQVGYGTNCFYGYYPNLSANVSQRAVSGSTALGNPTRGDFISLLPVTFDVNGSSPTSLRYGQKGISLSLRKALGLAVGDTGTNLVGYGVGYVSNILSDTTGLNMTGEIWGVSPVQVAVVGSTSYSKVILTKLVYA